MAIKVIKVVLYIIRLIKIKKRPHLCGPLIIHMVQLKQS